MSPNEPPPIFLPSLNLPARFRSVGCCRRACRRQHAQPVPVASSALNACEHAQLTQTTECATSTCDADVHLRYGRLRVPQQRGDETCAPLRLRQDSRPTRSSQVACALHASVLSAACGAVHVRTKPDQLARSPPLATTKNMRTVHRIRSEVPCLNIPSAHRNDFSCCLRANAESLFELGPWLITVAAL